ncbi:MAG: sulfatase-like hydrolase/transferase, partial [Gemmataceae bacterium]
MLLRTLLLFLSLSAVATAAPPNIVIILADDLGYGDVGCFGQKFIQTPNLDQLAVDGTKFTNAYAGSTVCGPSRACLMTGFHTGHGRIRGNGSLKVVTLREPDITIAKRLQSAGYRTGLVGKWGLGDLPPLGQSGLPNRMGFDEFFGYLNHGHAHNYYPSFLYENETKLQLPNTVPKELSNGAGVSTDKVAYAPDRCIEVAVKFIKTHKAKPFFLYFASTIPHANNEAGEKGMEIPSLGAY